MLAHASELALLKQAQHDFKLREAKLADEHHTKMAAVYAKLDDANKAKEAAALAAQTAAAIAWSAAQHADLCVRQAEAVVAGAVAAWLMVVGAARDKAALVARLAATCAMAAAMSAKAAVFAARAVIAAQRTVWIITARNAAAAAAAQAARAAQAVTPALHKMLAGMSISILLHVQPESARRSAVAAAAEAAVSAMAAAVAANSAVEAVVGMIFDPVERQVLETGGAVKMDTPIALKHRLRMRWGAITRTETGLEECMVRLQAVQRFTEVKEREYTRQMQEDEEQTERKYRLAFSWGWTTDAGWKKVPFRAKAIDTEADDDPTPESDANMTWAVATELAGGLVRQRFSRDMALVTDTLIPMAKRWRRADARVKAYENTLRAVHDVYDDLVRRHKSKKAQVVRDKPMREALQAVALFSDEPEPAPDPGGSDVLGWSIVKRAQRAVNNFRVRPAGSPAQSCKEMATTQAHDVHDDTQLQAAADRARNWEAPASGRHGHGH